jgi:hypothetical protein
MMDASEGLSARLAQRIQGIIDREVAQGAK